MVDGELLIEARGVIHERNARSAVIPPDPLQLRRSPRAPHLGPPPEGARGSPRVERAPLQLAEPRRILGRLRGDPRGFGERCPELADGRLDPRADGGVFNVGTGIETSVRELWAALHRSRGGRRGGGRGCATRLGELQRSSLDAGRAARTLGWRAEVDLPHGLQRTWEWIREE